MPGRDEEMESPEEIQEQADKDITTLKYRLLSLRDEYEMVLRDVIKKEFEGEIEGLQRIIRTLRGEISSLRTWLGNAMVELPADIYVIFRTRNQTNIEYSEFAEAVRVLREQREELIRQKACRDIEENGFNGTMEEFHSLTERPALNTVHEHDQQAEKDHEAVSVLLSLINEACCRAQDAINDPGKMADLRSYCANVLPLKALGRTPKGPRDR